jgi:glycerol-1-phosphate dehydrogenase [NAD(P)+]
MSPNGTPVTIPEALRAAHETRALEIGTAILTRSPALFRQQFGDRKALIVTDEVTLEIAGRTVFDAFRKSSQACFEPFVFSGSGVYAEHGYVVQLENVLKQSDAIPIAVGSGTINDLTKLAAHRVGRPYMCVATAASMDGYTAFGASITHNGSKQTFACPAPAVVLADLEVIRAAPAEMNAAGYADLLAKITAGADWILADALGVEPIAPEAWRIVQPGLKQLVGNPEGVRAREAQAVAQLVEGLMLGGFAMQSARTSRAASGAEHQFSHLWDMQHHTYNGQAPSHGFKVGIATLAVTALYECFLGHPIEDLDISACCDHWPDEKTTASRIREIFPAGDLLTVALDESRAKAIGQEALRAQLELLRRSWPDLKIRLREQLLPFSKIKAMLHAAGAPVEPEQLGISRQRLRDSYLQASLIRRRFTILDVVVRAGLLESCLGQIFGSAGSWPLPPSRAATTAKAA